MSLTEQFSNACESFAKEAFTINYTLAKNPELSSHEFKSVKTIGAVLEKNGIPPVRDLLEQIVEMGGHLWGCKMTVDLMELRQNMMFKGVSGIITAPDFIKKSEDAQIIFI